LGSITKAGSSMARWLLAQGAHRRAFLPGDWFEHEADYGDARPVEHVDE
jgi:hypothetical protein